MKKILAILAVAAMALSINVSKVNAQSTTQGVVYYDLKLVNAKTLAPGTYYLSMKGDLENPNFESFIFPTDLAEASLEVTGGLDTSSSYYGKDLPGKPLNMDGYPVNVVKRDSNFDSCPTGHIFAPEKDAAGVQKWRYFCDGGARQDIGPYYIYSVKTATYNSKSIKATLKRDLTNEVAPVTIVEGDVELAVEFSAGGRKFSNPSLPYTVDPSDNTVDFAAGDTTVNLLLEGDSGTYVLIYDVKNNVFLNKEPEPTPEPTPTPTQPKQSPKTGMPNNALPMGIIVLGLGAFGVLEIKKRKLN